MTLWDHACCVGYGLQARLDALWHLCRGHRLHWRDDIEVWVGVTGSIWCERCPDTSDGVSDLIIWTRQWAVLNWAAARVCGWMGHPEIAHPQRHNPDAPGGYEVVANQWYCTRCAADVKPPTPPPQTGGAERC